MITKRSSEETIYLRLKDSSILEPIPLALKNGVCTSDAVIIQYANDPKTRLIIVDDLELCQTIRANQPNLPIWVVVGFDAIDDALAHGATDCLIPPIHPRLLMERIQRMIANDAVELYQQSQAQIRSAEQYLHALVDLLADTVFVLDRQGTYLRVGVPGHQGTQDSPQDIIGKSLYDFTSRGQADRILALIEEALATGKPQVIDYSLGIRGKKAWYSTTISPLNENEVLSVVRNITESKQSEEALRESEKRYRNLFANANDGILLIDIETATIIEANPQIARMLGYQVEELIGKPINMIELTSDHDQQGTRGPATTNHLIVESQYLHKNGGEIPVETSNRIVTFGGKATILSFIRDVSERKRTLLAEQQQRIVAEALRDTADAFSRAMNLDSVFDTVLRNLSRVIGSSSSANIMLIDGENVRIVRHFGYDSFGLDDNKLHQKLFPLKDVPNLWWVYQHRQPLVIPDIAKSMFGWADTDTASVVRSIVTAPISIGDEIIGFINVDSPETGRFDSEDGQRLQAFASQASIAVQNARLFEQIQTYTLELENRVEERAKELVATNNLLREQIVERQKIEERLESERTLLRTLIDNIPDQIYVRGVDGSVLLANTAAINLASTTDGRIQGRGDHMLPDKDASDRMYIQEIDVLNNGTSIVNQEDSYVDEDGLVNWYLTTKIPLHDNNQTVIGIVSINRDITDLKTAQAKLSNERNLLRAIVDTIPDSIYVKDKYSRFILVNEATMVNMNISKVDAIQGKTDYDFFPEDRAAAFMAIEQSIIESGEAQINQSEVYINEDGQLAHILVSKLPLRDPQGQVYGIIGVNHDISELRRAESQLEQVLKSARCLLWSMTTELDANGNYTWQMRVANEQAAQTFLPLNNGDASYSDVWEQSILPEDSERRRFVFQTHMEFGKLKYSHEFRCRDANGEIVWLLEDVQIEPIVDGRWHVVGVCTGITERKLAEDRLQQINEELEKRVNERTRELTKANRILRQEISERQRAEEAEREQRILAEALHTSVMMINSTLDRDEVFEQLLQSIIPVIPHDGANIMLLDGFIARVVRARGYGDTPFDIPYDIRTMSNFMEIYQTGQSFIIRDTREVSDFHDPDKIGWIRSNLSVPISLEGRIIGFLNLDSVARDHFTQQHATWLLTFATQVGTAIRNARLVNEIREYASSLEQRVQERTQELELERAQLQAILDAMRDGVFYQDVNQLPQYINQSLVTISGYSMDEWIDGTAQQLTNTQGQEELDSLWRKVDRTLTQQGYWEGQTILMRKDGTIIDVALVRTEVCDPDGNRRGIVTVIRDISQAKQLEAQKARFIATAAHELRTPIANLKTRMFLMRRKPERFMEHMDIADSVLNLMQNLVEDMFDLSRFERGILSLEKEEMVVQEWLSHVIQYQQPEAERQQIDLRAVMPDEPILIWADPYRLTQVVSNLIGNALRYTPPDGKIHVIVQTDAQNLMMDVTDSGQGIAPEHIPLLFQPFFRASEASKGAGLGLAIVQEIIELYGGKISIESVLDKGTTFHIYIPLDSLQAPVKE